MKSKARPDDKSPPRAKRSAAQESDFNEAARPFVRALIGMLPQFEAGLEVLDDGHFEASLMSEAASAAGAIVCRSFSPDQVWVRFLPADACYPVESASEMVAIVSALMQEQALMAVIANEKGWVGTTLVRPGTVPKLEPGQTARIFS